MVLCVGSFGLDTTRTPLKTVERVLGGSCSYFAASASYFTKVKAVGVVGTDFPKEYPALLSKLGVDLSGLETRTGKTFSFDSTFDHSLYHRTQNAIDFGVVNGYVPNVPKSDYGDFLFLATFNPDLQLKIVREANAKHVFMDTIEFFIANEKSNVEKVLREVNGVILNDSECRMLTREPNLVKAGKKIVKDYGNEYVIIKKGEHGCTLFTENEVLPFSALPLEDIVDPTGAGDSFAGGFIGNLEKKGKINDKTLRESIAYGHVMGSFAVQAFSLDKIAHLTQKDITKRFEEYKLQMSLLC